MISGLRAGHESAYASLFNTFYRPLSVFATKYVIDLETAKEIVQDLIVHMYENRKALVISTSLKSYLYQAVRNRCLNHLKHDLQHKNHLNNLSRLRETTEDMEELLRATELEHRIFHISSKLPPRCREIFQMSRIDGLKNKEIALKLNISIRTVETQISNSLRILREKLGDDFPSG